MSESSPVPMENCAPRMAMNTSGKDGFDVLAPPPVATTTTIPAPPSPPPPTAPAAASEYLD